MTTRTDIHAPSSIDFDPESYVCFGVFDLFPGTDVDPMTAAAEMKRKRETVSRAVDAGYRFASHQVTGQCGHCGARLRYAALMVQERTHQMIWIGETCLDGRFEMTAPEFQRLRKEAALNKERIAKSAKIAALLAEHPVLVWASYAHNIGEAGGVVKTDEYEGYQYTEGGWAEQTRQRWAVSTLADIWYKVSRYADPSEKQIAFVASLVERLTEAEERRTEREAKAAALVASGVQVPTGRLVVEGEIVSTKVVESQYGSTLKMLVLTDAGWKVWGTVPSSLPYDTDKGARVRFTATVEPSDDDQTFGFFKRPTKAEVI